MKPIGIGGGKFIVFASPVQTPKGEVDILLNPQGIIRGVTARFADAFNVSVPEALSGIHVSTLFDGASAPRLLALLANPKPFDEGAATDPAKCTRLTAVTTHIGDFQVLARACVESVMCARRSGTRAVLLSCLPARAAVFFLPCSPRCVALMETDGNPHPMSQEL